MQGVFVGSSRPLSSRRLKHGPGSQSAASSISSREPQAVACLSWRPRCGHFCRENATFGFKRTQCQGLAGSMTLPSRVREPCKRKHEKRFHETPMMGRLGGGVGSNLKIQVIEAKPKATPEKHG